MRLKTLLYTLCLRRYRAVSFDIFDTLLERDVDRPVDVFLRVGDIVLARVGDRFIMHRVFKVDGGSLTLMGDGNIRGTETCLDSDVIGKVIQIRKENGKVVTPGKGKFWRMLMPLRRYILAFYKRVIL